MVIKKKRKYRINDPIDCSGFDQQMCYIKSKKNICKWDNGKNKCRKMTENEKKISIFGIFGILIIVYMIISIIRWGMMYNFKTPNNWYKEILLNYSIWTKEDVKNKCLKEDDK